jgi:hypothetical protein
MVKHTNEAKDIRGKIISVQPKGSHADNPAIPVDPFILFYRAQFICVEAL